MPAESPPPPTESEGGDRDPVLSRADALRDEATALRASGRYGEAERRTREALALRERVLGPAHPDVAALLVNLTDLLYAQGAYAAARPLAERSLEIQEAALGPDHPAVAMALNNLAMLLDAAGDLTGARPLMERVVAIREATLGPDHTDVGTALNNLAMLLDTAGDFAGARPMFERALAVQEVALGPAHPEVAAVLNNLAGLLNAQGDYDRARPLFERALAIREAALGPGHPHVANVLNNLAGLLYDQGCRSEARPLLERALAIWEAALGPDHLHLASVLNNLAGLRNADGDFEGARPLLERSIAIREAALGPTHPEVVAALNNLAFQLRARGDYVSARPLFERALTIREVSLGSDHPLTASVRTNLASLCWASGDLPSARAGFLRAALTLDRHAAAVLPVLSPAEQHAFVDQIFGAMTGLLLSLADTPDVLTELYAAFAGSKGLLLQGLRQQGAVYALADDPKHADSIVALRATRAGVAHAVRTGAGSDALEELEVRREELERALARALPAGVLGDPWEGSGVPGLRAALPADAAFVDVYRYAWSERGEFVEWRYGAVVTGHAWGPLLVVLGAAAALDDAVTRWRGQRQYPAVRATATLGRQVWAPIAAALPPGTAQVWISPDGALTRIPWSALAEARARIEDDEADPLVAQIPSARALLHLLSSAPTRGGGSVLVVGGVDFGVRTELALPHSATEVDQVAAYARAVGLVPQTLTGAEATPEAVARAAGTVTYAHIATHGFFEREERGARDARLVDATRKLVRGWIDEDHEVASGRSPLSTSRLALAGASGGPEYLTAEELVGLDLRAARLVVLSACDSGRGAEVAGQGVLGLQAAVVAAGARALLMSVWKVPDEATAALMAAFYRGLWEEGRSPASALRQAQAEVRSTGWNDLEDWAGWVLLGDVF